MADMLREQDREVVTTYYAKHSGLPPGVAKCNRDLPPGLEKQLARKGTLPPELQKKLRPCPVEITRQLPRFAGRLPAQRHWGAHRGVQHAHQHHRGHIERCDVLTH
jgi:hypothetical protein